MDQLPKQRRWHVWHGEKFWVLSEWREPLASIGLQAGKDWARITSDEPVSGSYHTTHSFRFILNNKATVYFKRYVYRKFRFKHWLQPTKAAVEAAGLHDLQQLGIPTIQPVAYGERRRLGLLRATFIVTKGLEGCRELDNYLARTWFKLTCAEKQPIKQHLQQQLIQQLQRCHKAGFFHWDLKLRNILIQGEPDNADLVWIDCPRSRWLKPNHGKGVITDLAAMARVGVRVLTPGQRFRFLLEYTENDRNEARQLYQDIAVALHKRPPRPYWHLLATDDPIRVEKSGQQNN